MSQAPYNNNKEYSFSTEKIKEDIFYFVIQDEQPVKLGDGTFGVVYHVQDKALKDYAVKILYENQALDQATVKPVLSDDIIDSFIKKFNLKNEDPVVEKIKTLQQKVTDNLSSFTFELNSIVSDKEQYSFLLDQVMKIGCGAVRERFMDETNAAIEIRKSLQESRERGEREVPVECVIETLGGTEKFRSSPAYMHLQDTFEASHVKLSNYALVMPLYDLTLKELLEKGIESFKVRKSNGTKEELDERSKPIEEESKQISEENKNKPGYDILKSMEFDDRIATILPYLIKTATGLKVLYAADLSHFDLKPDNIFVKKTQGFEVVIGDLGFLKSKKESEGTKVSSIQDSLPLGTRHYRSPEQKDFFDICNVEIRQDTDDTGNIYSLVVRDPKFRDTIIEEEDYLVFSKDAARVKYKIQEITKNDDNNSIVIKLRTKKDYKELKPEKQTQIILYKRHGIRTDLFGLGALAFDMLTCGASPERFYDNIRADDVEGKDITSLMHTYRAVSNFQSSEPRLVHAFAPLKHQNYSNYAPFDIVELILKCMFYKAKQTFYKANKDLGQEEKKSNRRIMEAVLDELLKLGSIYQPRYDDNPLKMGVVMSSRETSSSTLSQEIKKLQNYSIEKLPFRMAQGIWYFTKLVNFVRNIINSDQDIFFSELLPEYFTIDSSDMKLSYILYNKGEDYRNDLKNDSVFTKIMRDITNPYVPDYITSLRRSISLAKGSQPDSFRYTFNDSSSQGNQVSVDDWIIINSQAWRIATVSNHEITLKDEASNQATDLLTTDGNFASYIYYKNLEPCTYYLSMLGIYLYQIFFVGLGDATVNKPLIVSIAKCRLYMTNGSQDVKIKDFPIEKQNAERMIETIFQTITQMYVKLTFFEDKNSFYKEKENDKERLNAVVDKVARLQTTIEEFLEVQRRTLDYLATDNVFDNQKIESLKSKKKIFDCVPQNLEFNELINSFLSIELPKQESPKKSWLSRLPRLHQG